MSYIVPQPHKCTKCSHEQQHSPHDGGLMVVDDEPLCPKCLSEFLRKNVGILKCTVNFRGDGSEYDRFVAGFHVGDKAREEFEVWYLGQEQFGESHKAELWMAWEASRAAGWPASD
jgi:hypothetical protein